MSTRSWASLRTARRRGSPPIGGLIRLDRDRGTYELDVDRLDFLSEPQAYLGKLADLLGVPARQPHEPVTREHADIAASVQRVLELSMVDLLGWLSGECDSTNLCLAGGVALNCRANAYAFEASSFERVFIQPASGDAGAAVGAALVVDAADRPAGSVLAMRDAFLGPAYSSHDVADLLRAAGIPFTDFRGNERAMLAMVATALADGKIVGWFQGRMEFGPRALGARSILADPRRAETRDLINRRVKRREEFRPFAPAVVAGRAGDYFAMTRESPFMIDLFRVLRPDVLGAVTHVDGTARVQTVDEDVSPRFCRLIRRFGEITGVPVLLNTSFNRSDEPIVCSPVDAIRTFLRADLDVLCVEDLVVDGSAVSPELRRVAWDNQRLAAAAPPGPGAEVYTFF